MEKENIIDSIIRGESIIHSEDLFNWVDQSDENRKEYIRYKNTRALLQRGKEMDEKSVREDFNKVKTRLKFSGSRLLFYDIMKYAAVIVITFAGGFAIRSLNLNKEEMAMNEISVPNGNRTSLILPDGSKAWLTNGSKLVYPETFKGRTRSISLEGEAFFTVAHLPEKPFIVNVGEHRIRVTGTEFSVIAYPDDHHIQVDLVSGNVELDVRNAGGKGNYTAHPLKSMHSIMLDKLSCEIKQSRISDSFFSYWQKGTYEFKDESFAVLAKKIERIYGVKIIFKDEVVKKRTFTGSFHIDDNIYTLIEIFRRASGKPFEFSIDKNQITLRTAKI